MENFREKAATLSKIQFLRTSGVKGLLHWKKCKTTPLEILNSKQAWGFATLAIESEPLD